MCHYYWAARCSTVLHIIRCVIYVIIIIICASHSVIIVVLQLRPIIQTSLAFNTRDITLGISHCCIYIFDLLAQ